MHIPEQIVELDSDTAARMLAVLHNLSVNAQRQMLGSHWDLAYLQQLLNILAATETTQLADVLPENQEQ